MPVVIAMLRGVNVGGHNKIKMDALRTLCTKLKLRDACTYVQSGNVIFRTEERDLALIAKRLQNAIERKGAADVWNRQELEQRHQDDGDRGETRIFQIAVAAARNLLNATGCPTTVR